ncbi:MAG: FRG domain-containing protein [Lachnospiraceae bacterium]|nr:FRG domain-containing protein [Lachnospiraceae bacterium]
MIKTVEIADLTALFQMVSEQEYRPDLKRYRNLFIYRGQPDAAFRMETSLQRVCKDKKKELEYSILQNFTKYAALEEPTVERSVWHQLILGQHHGLPTRLLDWSYSPLIALHFALTEDNYEMMDKHDCVVWRIDINELHKMLPGRYRAVEQKSRTTVFSVEMLEEACGSLDQYDDDMDGERLVVIEPPSVDPRIANQYSFFSVIPSGMNDIEEFLNGSTSQTVRYVIKKDLRWQIRDFLDHQNINERLIYPGLDGIARWLGRHYYVMN